MTNLSLIVGLGNPGSDYDGTRHNLGFLVVDSIARDLGITFTKCSFTKAYTAQHKTPDGALSLLKPMTFMNNSGRAVRDFGQYFKMEDLSRVLVVCDDLNLPFGEVRIRPRGSDGGHNGLKSIIETLGSQDFPRLRMGIGHPGNKEDVVRFVLEAFDRKEKSELNDFIGLATQCCTVWADKGINKAMEQFNKRNKDEQE